MDAALLGAIIIACCFAAGVFETSKRRGKRSDDDPSTRPAQRQEPHGDPAEDADGRDA